MHRHEKSARATLSALGATLLLVAGCAQLRTQPVSSQPGSASIAALDLSPAEVRHAQALAEYATGIALEGSQGQDAALPHYLRSVELDPHNVALTIRLADALIRQKEPERALTLLEESVKANPTSPDAWNWLGVVYRTTDQIPKAIATQHQALKIDPTHLNSIQTLLDIYVQQDAVADAAKLLERCRRQASTDYGYWLRLGDFHLIILKQKPSAAKSVRPADVQMCYERAEALAPDEPDVLLRLATFFEGNQNYQRATEYYSKFLARRPNELPIRAKLAGTYIEAGNKEKAVAELEEIIKRDPLRYEIYNLLGDLYEDLKQDERAISAYRESLVLNRNQIEPGLRITLLQIKQKKFDEAEKTLAGLKDKFPAAFQVPYFYGLLYSDKKDYARAVGFFADAETLTNKTPQDPKVESSFWFYYGAACERTGDLDKAERLFRKSIELDPNKHEACNYLGYMWADKGIHLDEALDLINKALKLEADNGAYLDSLGWVLYKLGRTDEALPPLRRAAEQITDDAIVFDHLAEVLMKLGKRDEAVAQLQRAIKVDPQNKDISEKLQKLLADQTGAH